MVMRSDAPPGGDSAGESNQTAETELQKLLQDAARVRQELRQRVEELAARYPQNRDIRFVLAEMLQAAGEYDLAVKAYRALLEDASPNERRRIEQAIRQAEPEAAYQTPGYLHYLNTQKFGRPEHRDYLLRDLDRGRQVVRLLQQRMALRGRRLLDVGSSHGGMVMALAEQGAQVVGVEIDPRRSEVGRERIRELGFEVEWHTGDICDPGLVRRLDRFDGIICQDVLEHVMDPQLAIRHISMLLRPGGFVYVAVPNKYAPDFILADHHYKLMGISLLSRPQGVEYFTQATGIPGEHYGVGYYRTEKYYRAAFARWGVTLEPIERYSRVEHVLWYAPTISMLAARLATPAAPSLRPELNQRIRKRAKKVVELYVHSSRVLKTLENEPENLAMACHLTVSRLCVSVWRFIGTKAGGKGASA